MRNILLRFPQTDSEYERKLPKISGPLILPFWSCLAGIRWVYAPHGRLDALSFLESGPQCLRFWPRPDEPVCPGSGPWVRSMSHQGVPKSTKLGLRISRQRLLLGLWLSASRHVYPSLILQLAPSQLQIHRMTPAFRSQTPHVYRGPRFIFDLFHLQNMVMVDIWDIPAHHLMEWERSRARLVMSRNIQMTKNEKKCLVFPLWFMSSSSTSSPPFSDLEARQWHQDEIPAEDPQVMYNLV